jgi:hypothetical protein
MCPVCVDDRQVEHNEGLGRARSEGAEERSKVPNLHVLPGKTEPYIDGCDVVAQVEQVGHENGAVETPARQDRD